MWLRHKLWELENEGVQCTYELMGDLDPHSTSEESTEQDPQGKGKLDSHFKIKIKGVQEEEAQGVEKQRKPITKKRTKTKKSKNKETEKQILEVDAPMPKRRRIVRLSQKAGSKDGVEVAPPMVDVESSG